MPKPNGPRGVFVKEVRRLSLLSYSRAALELGIDRRDLAVLVRILGIEPKRIEFNGKAKGLDVGDMERLRKALRGRMRKLAVRVG